VARGGLSIQRGGGLGKPAGEKKLKKLVRTPQGKEDGVGGHKGSVIQDENQKKKGLGKEKTKKLVGPFYM